MHERLNTQQSMSEPKWGEPQELSCVGSVVKEAARSLDQARPPLIQPLKENDATPPLQVG